MRPSSGNQAERGSLRTESSGVIIVAHREDTSQLRGTLAKEGFSVDEVRGPYTDEQLNYSASIRCLINHANAWRIASERDRPTIIVEADFVPVGGFGNLPTPVPREHAQKCLVYLYACGPQVWDLVSPAIARGHAGGAVALLVPPAIAGMLLQFFAETLMMNPQGNYEPWDTKIGYWLLERGVQSFIPYRHYGEHGGIGNPEHATAGLGRPHQADVLQGRLAFMPAYAGGSTLRFLKTRLRARVWGAVRLLIGRLLAWHDFSRSKRVPMLRFAIGRFALKAKPGR